MTLTALIVDDDETSGRALARFVKDEGYVPYTVSNLADARKRIEEQPPAVALVDLMLPDGHGLELRETLSEAAPDCAMIIITGHATVDTAVDALRRGVADYLTKPLDIARLKAVFVHLRRQHELDLEIGALRDELKGLGRFAGIVGSSPVMQRVFEHIQRVAATRATVLVLGASGTGKELVAQGIHRLSKRRSQPLVTVNCGAISPQLIESELFGHERGSFTGAERQHQGYFERASRGTLFLDEVSEMPPELQVKLLRVLETGQVMRVGGREPIAVDLRVVAASNRDLDQAVAEGKFRQDLLYRLKVFPINLPLLYERGGDVEQLAEHFLAEVNRAEGRRQRLGAEALAALSRYHWPGNVRELKNVIYRAAILAGDEITVGDLPAEILGDAAPPEPGTLRVAPGTPLAEVQRRLVLATMNEFNQDRSRTADALGISVRTLYNWLKEYQANGAWTGDDKVEEAAAPASQESAS